MPGHPKPPAEYAVRAVASGTVQGAGLRDATVARAHELGVLGWVRHGDDGEVLCHAEGRRKAVEPLLEFLRSGPAEAQRVELDFDEVQPEGHEQFAIRGVSAGRFEVLSGLGARGTGYALSLEVDGTMRVWNLAKEPAMDPATRRMAFESPLSERGGEPWDGGTYERGGRVPWPEAIERGHAVFVLHGEKLSGGFALQRIRPGSKPQWLLVKRRDDHARPARDG